MRANIFQQYFGDKIKIKKDFHITDHSKKLTNNSIFFARQGVHYHGNDFINDNDYMKLNKDTGSTIFMETHDNGGSDAYENIIKISNGYIAVGYIQADDPENTFFTEGTGYFG